MKVEKKKEDKGLKHYLKLRDYLCNFAKNLYISKD